MKKNTMMRLAAVMLMCVLLTTSVVGGTFAKYVTSETGGDSARVAKWGVTVTVNGDTAFADEYDATDSAAIAKGVAKSVVEASGFDDTLVAPGTGGSLVTSSISGTPEVAVHVECNATLTLTGWEDDTSAYYCPLVITIDGTEYYGMNDAYLTAPDPAAAFIADVEAKLDADYYVQANTDLTTGHTVDWSWPFYTSDDNDKKDTALGDAGTAKIEFTYEITVTQVD